MKLPHADRYDRFRVDTVRTKTKRVYAGTFQGHAMRFTSTLTRDADGEHVQLGGCAPGVQAALLGDVAACVAPLKAMTAFCEAMVALAK